MDTRAIFNINSDSEFERVALEVFRYQYSKNAVYRQWCELRKTDPAKVQSISSIPFLPVEFFKSKIIADQELNDKSLVFTSSATTSAAIAKHYVVDPSLYEESFMKAFELF